MSKCYASGDFGKYFNENMKALGLPVPSSMFDTYNAAIANAAFMVEALATLGKGATVTELALATTRLEKLKVIAAFGAAYYTGAVIGSIAVASGRALSCGTRISDMFVFLRENNLEFSGWREFYLKNPEVLDGKIPVRVAYRAKAMAPLSRDLA